MYSICTVNYKSKTQSLSYLFTAKHLFTKSQTKVCLKWGHGHHREERTRTVASGSGPDASGLCAQLAGHVERPGARHVLVEREAREFDSAPERSAEHGVRRRGGRRIYRWVRPAVVRDNCRHKFIFLSFLTSTFCTLYFRFEISWEHTFTAVQHCAPGAVCCVERLARVERIEALSIARVAVVASERSDSVHCDLSYGAIRTFVIK